MRNLIGTNAVAVTASDTNYITDIPILSSKYALITITYSSQCNIYFLMCSSFN